MIRRVMRRTVRVWSSSPGAAAAGLDMRMAAYHTAFIFVVLTMLAPFYWASLHTRSVGYYHDDAIYVVTAKALAEGRGYRHLHLPEEPVQTKYPVVLPALLALV